jgi:hypothetical protein
MRLTIPVIVIGWQSFEMQYSGHLLSRLCQHRLNRAKQTGFTTTWGQHWNCRKTVEIRFGGFHSETKTLHSFTYLSGLHLQDTCPLDLNYGSQGCTMCWLAIQLSCGWGFWDLVCKIFGTRYSGHLLSRLAVSLHNTTKHPPFPISWRDSLKEHSTGMSLCSFCAVWFSMVTYSIHNGILLWGWTWGSGFFI